MTNNTLHDINIYERHEFQCGCGKTHIMPIGEVSIGAGVSTRLPEFVQRLNLGNKGVLITDEVIFNSVGKSIYESWKQAGLDIDLYVLKGRISPNEETVGLVTCHVPFDAEYLVSIGGGTVTDVVRYVATRLKLPGVSIPSAMTMDGFFTNMSVIIVNSLQNTYYLDYPSLLLADTDIIRKAPPFMNGAGVGEVVSKISAAMDWYASGQIKDLPYCDVIADMMGQCIQEGSCEETVQGIASGDEHAIWNLTDGLYKSAVGMAWYGSSPCGSGAEHQLNHFWIMCQDNKHVRQSMHGQSVGVGAVVNMMIWEDILSRDFSKLDIDALANAPRSRKDWEDGVRRVYGVGADDILHLQEKNHSFDPAVRRAELNRIVERIDLLRAKFDTLPHAQELSRRLEIACTANSPQQLNIDRNELIDSILFAKEMRTNRYNSLWMLETLGIQEEVANRVADRLGL